MPIFTNLNLNADVPTRAQPVLGEWGPTGVPTTKSKRRARIWVSLALVGVIGLIVAGEAYVFRLLNG